MKTHHMYGLVILVVAYFVGAKWPQLAQKTGLV
jgi:hypothetical protein